MTNVVLSNIKTSVFCGTYIYKHMAQKDQGSELQVWIYDENSQKS